MSDKESEDEENTSKICSTCKEDKPFDNFRKSANSKDGFGSMCKSCLKIQYAEKLKDPNHKLRLAKLRADNHIKNRDKYNQRHKEDFQKNKEKIYKRRKVYYVANPDKMLAELHRQHLRNAFKSGKEAPDLLGCDKEFLSKWFEFQFTFDPEMKLENHGTYWHIDHVLPINKWNLTDEEHKKLCFNWKNLMPLKAFSNISKHDNIDMEQIKELDKRLELFSEITGEVYPKTPVHILLDSKTH